VTQIEYPFTPIVAADGTAKVTVKVRNGLDVWSITQVSLELSTAPAGATCYVRKNGYPVSPAVPTGDTVAGDPPVILQPSDELTVEWTGCTPGTAGRVLVTGDDGRD
jgi:hypothetical protein